MRFVVLGTSEFALACAEAVLEAKEDLAALVTLSKDLLPDNSADYPAAAKGFGVPCHEVRDINSPDTIKLLTSLKPDYIFCSWPKILSAEVLTSPDRFVIGTHPTELPFNRGRHPLHWLIVLGIPQTALTFFRMDPGIDTGNILHSEPFEIGSLDIQSAVRQLNDAGRAGMRKLILSLRRDPNLPGTLQDHTKANYWRARTPHDGTIDFRMNAEQLSRLARSFSPPYPCAKLWFGHDAIPVSSIEPAGALSFKEDEIQRMEPGKILSSTRNTLTVKAADKIVICKVLDELPETLRKAKYIFPPTYYAAQQH